MLIDGHPGGWRQIFQWVAFADKVGTRPETRRHRRGLGGPMAALPFLGILIEVFLSMLTLLLTGFHAAPNFGAQPHGMSLLIMDGSTA